MIFGSKSVLVELSSLLLLEDHPQVQLWELECGSNGVRHATPEITVCAKLN
jgi:hypothetical protein